MVHLGFLVLMGFIWLSNPTTAHAYPVPPLPDDNLIINPWFRSASNPSTAGLDGWTNVLNNGLGWGISQKESNPSPDLLIHGKCGFKEVYCGTGARWAAERWGARTGGDVLHPNVDVYLYQVVPADPSHRQLRFLTYFVLHRVEVVELTIYGGENSDGPWTQVWKPFALGPEDSPPHSARPGREGNPWYDTGLLETVMERGYPYYKIELHARYPDVVREIGEVGVKITGVYFSTGATGEPADRDQPALLTLPAESQSIQTGGQHPDSQPLDRTVSSGTLPQRTRVPTADVGTTSAAAEAVPSDSPVREELASTETTKPILWIGIGAISCGLLFLLIYGVRKII